MKPRILSSLAGKKILWLKGLPLLASLTILTGCSTYDSITGYFNTYYNTRKVFFDAVKEAEKAIQKGRDTNYFSAYTISPGTNDKFNKVIEKGTKLIQYHSESAWIENTLLMMGKSYYYKGESESAIRKYNELLENFPESDLVMETRLWQAKALYISRKNDEILGNLENLTAEGEKWGDENIIAELLMLGGQIHFDGGEYGLAAGEYEKASKLSVSDKLMSMIQFQMGQSYERMGETGKAAVAYGEMKGFVSDFSTEFRARLREGTMLSKGGKYDEAFIVFDDLSAENLKTDERGLVELEKANTYLSMNDTAEAFDLYRLIDTTYKRTDASAKAYYARGLQYENVYRDLKTALVYYNKAKGEFPSSEITPLATRKFNYLTNYFKRYESIARYDSLLLKAPASGSADDRPDSGAILPGITDSTGLKRNPGELVTDDRIDTAGQKSPDTLSIISGNATAGTDTGVKEISYKVGTWAKDKECLWNIAKRPDIYNDPLKWTVIWERNRNLIKNPDLIESGLILIIPSPGGKIGGTVDIAAEGGGIKKITAREGEKKNVSPETSLQVDTDFPGVGSKGAATLKNSETADILADTTHNEDSLVAGGKSVGDLTVRGNGLARQGGEKPVVASENSKVQDSVALNRIKDSASVKKSGSPAAKETLSRDSIYTLIAKTEFELAGLLFLEMNFLDSAICRYQNVIDSFPKSPYAPRSYYAMAEIYRSWGDTLMVDSLYGILLARYDTTVYAQQVKKNLGMGISETEPDSAEVFFFEAEKLLETGQYQEALIRYAALHDSYPHSSFAPKSLYSIGWIYESVLLNNDSAAATYRKLINEYPASVYADDIRPKVAVRDDPKSLEKYIKVDEIKPIVNRTAKTVRREEPKRGSGQQGENLPDRKGQGINIEKEEPDPADEEEEEEPADEDEDDGGG